MCSDAPDTSGMNAAAVSNAELAKEQAQLGREELANARARQAQFDPKFLQIIDAQLGSQRTADDRSQQQWDNYQTDFRPAEQRLAQQAAEYDTPGRRDEAAAEARAAVEREGDMQRQAQGRSLDRAGVSMSSGRALTLDNASRLTQSKAAAGADVAARNRVEATGMSLTDNVVKTGRGIASTGLQAAQIASAAGGAAGGSLQGQQGTYNASMTPTLSAFGGAVGAGSAALNGFGQIADVQQRTNASNAAGLAGLGSLAGTAMMFMSSKELKEVVGDVDPEDALAAVRKPAVKAWRYLGSDDVEVGPMAEDVHEATGLGNGKSLSVISELGQLRGAVQAIANRLDKLKPGRRSLADVDSDANQEATEA